jgi:hypothetical protein
MISPRRPGIDPANTDQSEAPEKLEGRMGVEWGRSTGSLHLEVAPRALLLRAQLGVKSSTLITFKKEALIGQYLLDLFLANEGIGMASRA